MERSIVSMGNILCQWPTFVAQDHNCCQCAISVIKVNNWCQCAILGVQGKYLVSMCIFWSSRSIIGVDGQYLFLKANSLFQWPKCCAHDHYLMSFGNIWSQWPISDVQFLVLKGQWLHCLVTISGI